MTPRMMIAGNGSEASRGLANGRDTSTTVTGTVPMLAPGHGPVSTWREPTSSEIASFSTTVGPIIGCSDGYVPNQDRTMCVPPSTNVTNLTGMPITQSDTSGHLMVYHHPDQPDGHWAIILVLALAVVWMWATGAILVWCCMAKVRWRSHTSVKMPTEFLKGQWRWRYLFWPLYVTGLKP